MSGLDEEPPTDMEGEEEEGGQGRTGLRKSVMEEDLVIKAMLEVDSFFGLIGFV